MQAEKRSITIQMCGDGGATPCLSSDWLARKPRGAWNEAGCPSTTPQELSLNARQVARLRMLNDIVEKVSPPHPKTFGKKMRLEIHYGQWATHSRCGRLASSRGRRIQVATTVRSVVRHRAGENRRGSSSSGARTAAYARHIGLLLRPHERHSIADGHAGGPAAEQDVFHSHDRNTG